MRETFYKIYFKLIKADKSRSFLMLDRLNIDKILNNLVKVCWKNNIQYHSIFKNNEVLMLYLSGKEDKVLLTFSKEKMIFEEVFQCFLTQVLKYNVKKAIFITTGVFEAKIIKSSNLFIYGNIKLIDKYTFIRHQLGIFGDEYNNLKEESLKFYKYLPIY